MVRRIFLVIWLCAGSAVWAGEARIVKVLPYFLDAKGRNALSPSLFERDAYQVYLRTHPDEIAGMRFNAQIKVHGKHGMRGLRFRLELRTSRTELGKVHVFETEVIPARWFSTWAVIQLDKATTEALGSVTAWRATLWDGKNQIAEQESFLW